MRQRHLVKSNKSPAELLFEMSAITLVMIALLYIFEVDFNVGRSFLTLIVLWFSVICLDQLAVILEKYFTNRLKNE